MNLKLLIVLIVLCLTACVGRTVKDASPASDVDALVANVSKTTKPVLLPNGKEYCAELALTEDEQDDCMGDLEDGLYQSNRNGERTMQTVKDYANRERQRRNPCKWWQLRCKNSATRP